MDRLSPLLLPVVVLAACGGGGEAPRATERVGPPRVVVTFYPTEYLTRRIAGERVEILCDVPDGADPLFWEPDRASLTRMQEADLIVLHGAGLEAWRGRVSLPESRLVEASKPLADQLLEFGQPVAHSHGGGEQHTHAGVDAHLWLDPQNAILQARAIHGALVRLLPGDEAELRVNLADLEADLEDLHRALTRAVPPGEQLYASHPAYGYLARRHGWSVVDLDLDPGAMPGDEVLEALGASLAQRPGRVLLWESRPAPAIAERLQSGFGLASVVYSPCELLGADQRAAGADFLGVQRANVERLTAALGAR